MPTEYLNKLKAAVKDIIEKKADEATDVAPLTIIDSSVESVTDLELLLSQKAATQDYKACNELKKEIVKRVFTGK